MGGAETSAYPDDDDTCGEALHMIVIETLLGEHMNDNTHLSYFLADDNPDAYLELYFQLQLPNGPIRLSLCSLHK